MSEMKTLNGYSFVDTTAREGVRQLSEEMVDISEELAELKNAASEVEYSVDGSFIEVDGIEGKDVHIITKFENVDISDEKAKTIAVSHTAGENLLDMAPRLAGQWDGKEAQGLKFSFDLEKSVCYVSGEYLSESSYMNVSEAASAEQKKIVFPPGKYRTCGTDLTYEILIGAVGVESGKDIFIGSNTGLHETTEAFTVNWYAVRVHPGGVNSAIPIVFRLVEDDNPDYVYHGSIYTATLSSPVANGTFDWNTGELKDASGNVVETVEVPEIVGYAGKNRFVNGRSSLNVSGVKNTIVISGGGGETSEAFNPDVWGLPVIRFNGDCTGMTKENYVPLTCSFQGMRETVDVKLQGSSSIGIGQHIGHGFDSDVGGLFNFTVKFPTAFEAYEGWGAQKKYCIKVNAIDHTHSRNVCSCKLWGEIVKSRPNVPAELSNLPNGGAIDGFPVIIMLNDKFYALGTFNIPKDGWMFESANYAPKAILCADLYVDSTKFHALATLDGDFKLEYVEDEDNADWVLTSINRAIQSVIDSDGSDLDTVVSQYFDIQSFIDYYIHAVHEQAEDGIQKNYILVTFDYVKWYISDYDRDTTYGLQADGKKIKSPTNGTTFAGITGHKMYGLIYNHKREELKARGIELRNTVLSEVNLGNVFYNFAGQIPSEIYAKNAKRWPLLRNTSVNTIDQILNWYRLRRQFIDSELDAL